jgi:hypothetical protein
MENGGGFPKGDLKLGRESDHPTANMIVLEPLTSTSNPICDENGTHQPMSTRI